MGAIGDELSIQIAFNAIKFNVGDALIKPIKTSRQLLYGDCAMSFANAFVTKINTALNIIKTVLG